MCLVDDTDQAKRLLSILLSHLYCIGGRHNSTLYTLPIFQDELLRRLWCCFYTLERELGLQTEGPALMRDSKVNFSLPRNLSNEWLASYSCDGRASCDLRLEIHEESYKNQNSPVLLTTYMKDRLWQARATDKIWGVLHHFTATKYEISQVLMETLEYSAQKAERLAITEAPTAFQESITLLEDEQSLQMGHRHLMHIVCHFTSASSLQCFVCYSDNQVDAYLYSSQKWCYLRLSIGQTALRQSRKAHRPESHDWDGVKYTCLHLIDDILISLDELPNEYPKFSFPFLGFWITSVRLGLELIAEDTLLEGCYGPTILQGLASLQNLASRTWLSARTTRSILSMGAGNQCSSALGSKRSSPSVRSTTSSKEATIRLPDMPHGLSGFAIPVCDESLESSNSPSEAPQALGNETGSGISHTIAAPVSIDSSEGHNDVDDSSSILIPPTSLMGLPLDATSSTISDNNEIDFTNILSHGVCEIGLDEAALYALSDIDMSPCGTSV